MNTIKWILLLVGGKGRPLPMVDENDEISLFDSSEDAEEAGAKNPLGQKRGFKVIRWVFFEG